MNDFFYHAPEHLHEALALLGPAARPLAGGTDLLTLMKPRLAEPTHLVAVRRLLASAIEENADGLTLGAGATLSAIEENALIHKTYTALSEAARLAASPQIRNFATIGGNLLQRPRCWYFRNPQVRCWLKGGDDCPAREGENQRHALFGGTPCVAVHPSDPACALLAFDAQVRIGAPRGERVVPLHDLLALPHSGRRSETTLREDELILGLRVPPHPGETRSTYLKAMDRGAFSFALVGVAAVLRVSNGKVGHARLVLGGVAPIPWRSHAAEEALLGSQVSPELFIGAAEAALRDAQPLAHNAWKIPLAKALVRRALETLAA